jgi:hypothetical protein
VRHFDHLFIDNFGETTEEVSKVEIATDTTLEYQHVRYPKWRILLLQPWRRWRVVLIHPSSIST